MTLHKWLSLPCGTNKVLNIVWLDQKYFVYLKLTNMYVPYYQYFLTYTSEEEEALFVFVFPICCITASLWKCGNWQALAIKTQWVRIY